ncbi:MAG TPA: hypothetical protein VML55_12400 [Planctomycetaceae bacterium]|nr:hypothetical protein [Planctomycetaceae bacterium]
MTGNQPAASSNQFGGKVHMLEGILRSLFGSPQAPRKPFNDPVLGELKPEEDGWSVTVTRGASSFGFTIGGEDQPDAALLAHARDILKDYESFTQMVEDCIEAESRDYRENAKAEVARLEIDNIALFWPDRPHDGMIFFRGSDDDVGLWRCDYVARKPRGLGCDT